MTTPAHALRKDDRLEKSVRRVVVCGKLTATVTIVAGVTLFASGCGSSGGGHRPITGAEHVISPARSWIEQGALCNAGPIPRKFDFSRDRVEIEVRPGISNSGGFWWGRDEWGRDVGGYLQLLSPWPIPAGYSGAFRLKCVLYCNPNTAPLQPDASTGYHELGGHANLVPGGVYDHPSRFRSCYPDWRLAVDAVLPGEQARDLSIGTIGPHVIYGPQGQVLHICPPAETQKAP